MVVFNKFRPWQNGQHFVDNIFHFIFFTRIVALWFKFQWNFSTMIQLTKLYHCFRWYVGVGYATRHYMNQWWASLLIHTSLRLSDWINQGTVALICLWSSLFQLIGCRLLCTDLLIKAMLNNCRLDLLEQTSGKSWSKYQLAFRENALDNVIYKMAALSSVSIYMKFVHA